MFIVGHYRYIYTNEICYI